MLQASGAVLNQGGDDVYLVSNRTLPDDSLRRRPKRPNRRPNL